MKKTWIALTVLVTFVAVAGAAWGAGPRAVIDTNHGSIVVELDAEKAPKTVASFIATAKSGFYKDTMFHRVVKGFMLQGGGFSQAGQLKPTSVQLDNEADNGLKNLRGTIAMARKNDPHSASVQFYINHSDNDFLDHKAPTPRGWGYAVFGQVVEGMDVVDAIAEVAVRRSSLSEAQPLETVRINGIEIVEGEPSMSTSSSSSE